MKRLITLLFLLTLPLFAATQTATVTVPNAQVAELATLFEAWIQVQKNSDGTLKFQGATVSDRRTALLNALLRGGVRRVIRVACSQFPDDCPQAIKDKIADRTTADTAIGSEVDALVQ